VFKQRTDSVDQQHTAATGEQPTPLLSQQKPPKTPIFSAQNGEFRIRKWWFWLHSDQGWHLSAKMTFGRPDIFAWKCKRFSRLEKQNQTFSSTQLIYRKLKLRKVLSVGKNLVKDEDLADSIEMESAQYYAYHVKYGLHTIKLMMCEITSASESVWSHVGKNINLSGLERGADYDVVKWMSNPELHRINRWLPTAQSANLIRLIIHPSLTSSKRNR